MGFLLRASWWKAKAVWIVSGLAFLGALLIRMEWLKNKNKRLSTKVQHLEAKDHLNKVQKKINKKARKEIQDMKQKVQKEIEKDDFEGIDSLSDSNNF